MFDQGSLAAPLDLAIAWLLQTSVVVGVALVLQRVLHRRSPHLHYAILMVALAKFTVPPLFFAPTGIFRVASETSSLQSIAANGRAVGADASAMASTRDRTAAATGVEGTTPGDPLPLGADLAEHRAYAIGRKLQIMAAGLYLLVSSLLGIQLLRRIRQLRRLVASASPLPESPLADQSLPKGEASQGPWRPQILVSEDASTAFATGLVRPRIVLPNWVLNQLSFAEQRWIVLHEQKHHQRWDVWVAWAQNFLTVVWWFHPAWWLLNRRILRVREESCDASVLSGQPSQASEYATALLSAARCIANHHRPGTSLVPGILSYQRSDPALQRRIQRIVTQPNKPTGYRFPALVAIGLAIVVLPIATPSADENEAECFTGTVVDTAGIPVADAMITTYPRLPGDPTFTVKTNTEGVFVIKGVRPPYPGAKELSLSGVVYKPGLELAAFSSMYQPCKVVLGEPDRILIALETPDGSRLPDANVTIGTVSFRDVAISGPPPDDIAQELSQTTDGAGLVSFQSVRRHQLRGVTVTTKPWGVQRLSVPRVEPNERSNFDEPIVIRLNPVGQIEGTIAKHDASPLSNCEVYLTSPLNYAQGAQVVTDAGGRFNTVLPVGRYRLATHSSLGGQTFPPQTVRVRANETTRVSIACQQTGEVAGRVVTQLGEPAANVPLAFSRTGDRRIVTTDQAGNYHIELGPGTWDYECFVNDIVGYVPPMGNQPRQVDVVSAGKTRVDDWVVTTGAVVPGRIEGIDTRQTRIRCLIAHRNDRESVWATYDARGQFELTIPNDIKIQDIKRFEIRFIDEPIEVVSYDPFVLRPQNTPGK